MFHEAMELNCAYNVGQMRFVELGSSSWVRRAGFVEIRFDENRRDELGSSNRAGEVLLSRVL